MRSGRRPSRVRPRSPADTLIKTAEWKPGELAEMTKITEGVERIRRAIRREGYMEARVLVDRKLDDEKKMAHISVRVDPGPAVHDGEAQDRGPRHSWRGGDRADLEFETGQAVQPGVSRRLFEAGQARWRCSTTSP